MSGYVDFRDTDLYKKVQEMSEEDQKSLVRKLSIVVAVILGMGIAWAVVAGRIDASMLIEAYKSAVTVTAGMWRYTQLKWRQLAIILKGF